eukprot:m.51683 g.51683  ORF g.51683 m.51683 type:complete len:197 (+) comp9068_c0_seq1:524-1114(+)
MDSDSSCSPEPVDHGARKKAKKEKKGKKEKKKKEKKEKREKSHKRKKSRSSDKEKKSKRSRSVAEQRKEEAEGRSDGVPPTVSAPVQVNTIRPVPSSAPRRRPTADEIAAARAGVVRRRPAAAVVQRQEDYLRQQSVVRKVYDPDTGRERLVRGDGEIIEEIVSKERQLEINAIATRGDGNTFQRTVGSLLGGAPR